MRPLLPFGVWLAALTCACGGGTVEKRSSLGAGGRAPCAECAIGGSSGDASAPRAGAPSAGTASAGSAGAGGQSNAPDDAARISEISFWQVMRVPLELRGVTAPPNAPIIVGKEGILRVYVEPDAKFRARALSAMLEFGADGPLAPFESKKLIAAVSTHAEFSSTFNFPLDSQQVALGADYSITLSDPASGAVLDRFPPTGQSPLGASQVSLSNRLDVVVVPLIVGGIEPDVSPATMAIFRTRVQSMYPVAELSITVHAAVASAVQVGPDQGWDAILDELYALRAADGPAADVFYYGLFAPKQTFDEYCTSDCTVGLSVLAAEDDVDSRGSVGLGIFADGSNRDAPDTMAHELGHALGRDHAPCHVSKQDSGPFPYPGGKIGVWGYDSPHHALLDPASYGDVMGYCSPDWISDFTYSALFERITTVAAEVTAKSLEPAHSVSAYRRVLLGRDGTLRWGSRFAPSHPPSGPTRVVTLLGAGGVSRGSVSAPFQRFADAAGGFLLLPEAALESSVRAVRFGSAELTLPNR